MLTSVLCSIVFVHGLTGNRMSTWEDSTSGVSWLRDLLAEDMPDARIMTFGYDADVVGLWNPASTNRISNRARDLLGALSRKRVGSDMVSM